MTLTLDKYKELRESQGEKHDDGKTRYSLIPPEALQGLAEIYTEGAKRHDDFNWLGLDKERMADALERHLMAYKLGKKWNTDDWGHHHLLHAAWNCMNLAFIDIVDRELAEAERSGFEEKIKNIDIEAIQRMQKIRTAQVETEMLHQGLGIEEEVQAITAQWGTEEEE